MLTLKGFRGIRVLLSRFERAASILKSRQAARNLLDLGA
jgi:hypothetical protein